MAAVVTFTALVHITETDTPDHTPLVELVVRKDVEAGVSGPFHVKVWANGVDMLAIEVELDRMGLARKTGTTWKVTPRRCDGIQLSAPLRLK